MQVRIISIGISVGLSVCQAVLAISYSPVLLLLLFKLSDPKINSDTSERCEVAHCTPPPPVSITISLSHAFSVCISLSLSQCFYMALTQATVTHDETCRSTNPTNIAATPTYSLSLRLFLSSPLPDTHTYTWYTGHKCHQPTLLHGFTNTRIHMDPCR